MVLQPTYMRPEQTSCAPYHHGSAAIIDVKTNILRGTTMLLLLVKRIKPLAVTGDALFKNL